MATPADALATPRPRSSTSIGRLIVEHPITAYFVLAIIGSWLFQAPMVLSSDGLGLIRFQVPFPIFIALFLLSTYLGPTLAAVVITNALEGRGGLKRFFRRYIQWRVGVVPYLMVLFGFPLMWLIAASSQMGLAPLQAIAARPWTYFTSYLPGVLVFPALIQWGEEPGWRGFALTRMQERYNPLVAALVVGLVHGIWHLPNFFMVAGPAAAGPFDPIKFGVNTVVIVIVTIIFSWVFNLANESILIAVLIHAALNATGAWMNGLIPNMPPVAGFVLYGIFALVALIIVIATKGRLGYRPQRTYPAAASAPQLAD